MGDGSVAVVFPGQGSQRPGMGKDFYDNVSVSRDAFNEASDSLGWDLKDVCFGDDERLNLTEYSQPCILATEIAMFRGLQSLYGFAPDYFGGHSLGEYSALVAAGVLSFPEALKTVQMRGRLMQQATPVGMGAMAAVIVTGLDVNFLTHEISALQVDLANDNSADQVVISGEAGAVSEAEKILALSFGDKAGFRFVLLNVSAPFHSRFMGSIEEPFEAVLRNIEKSLAPENASRVTSNFTGLFHSNSSGEIIGRLVSQLSNTVRWRKNMETLSGAAGSIFEVGPGRPLKGFFKTINIECQSIITLSAAQKTFERSRP